MARKEITTTTMAVIMAAAARPALAKTTITVEKLAMRYLSASLLLACLWACTSSPTGRSQLILMSETEMASLGSAAFAEIKRNTPTLRDLQAAGFVSCVVGALLRPVAGERMDAWEVVVFDDPAINAFALPGRKIGVYRGLLRLSENQHQLATVIGHEMAHVRARHANERVSTTYVTETGLQLVQIATGGASPARRQLFGLLGLGAQVGVLLPFNRAQESEADLIGMDLLSRAGFDPRESVALWQRMAAEERSKPPEFLSTHPSSEHRISDIRARMNTYEATSRAARSSGLYPDCR